MMLTGSNVLGVRCFYNSDINTRFMIGSDYCDEWYHGSCVGVDGQR